MPFDGVLLVFKMYFTDSFTDYIFFQTIFFRQFNGSVMAGTNLCKRIIRSKYSFNVIIAGSAIITLKDHWPNR